MKATVAPVGSASCRSPYEALAVGHSTGPLARTAVSRRGMPLAPSFQTCTRVGACSRSVLYISSATASISVISGAVNFTSPLT